MSGREAMLDMVRSQLGYRERADGSTKYGDWFAELVGSTAYRTGDWCAMGLLWAAWKSGNLDAVGGARKEWAWVPSWRDWFRQERRYTQTPAAGRIVYFDWEPNGIPNHVGIVESVGSGVVHTIEFNTSNACMRRDRSPSLILGYGDPLYPDSPSPAVEDDVALVVSLGA